MGSVLEQDMSVKQEILDIPRALRETLEKGRGEYEMLARGTRWGEGPIYLVGSGLSYLAGLSGELAFEELLGWPVVLRRAVDFQAYSASSIRPRKVLIAISQSGESPETLEAAQAARTRGAVVLALTGSAASSLARMADGVFLVRAGGGSGLGMKATVCQQAALGYLSLVTARALKRPHPALDALEGEFEKLPEQTEWVLAQLLDAVRVFAAELKGLRELLLVGAGCYYPVSLLEAHLAREIMQIGAHGFHPEDLGVGKGLVERGEFAVVFLSGSHCRERKKVHEASARVKKTGAKVLSVTDANDQELARRSAVALLLPGTSEIVGSTLTLALLQWLNYHSAVERGADPEGRRPRARTSQGDPGEIDKHLDKSSKRKD